MAGNFFRCVNIIPKTEDLLSEVGNVGNIVIFSFSESLFACSGFTNALTLMSHQ